MWAGGAGFQRVHLSRKDRGGVLTGMLGKVRAAPGRGASGGISHKTGQSWLFLTSRISALGWGAEGRHLLQAVPSVQLGDGEAWSAVWT